MGMGRDGSTVHPSPQRTSLSWFILTLCYVRHDRPQLRDIINPSFTATLCPPPQPSASGLVTGRSPLESSRRPRLQLRRDVLGRNTHGGDDHVDVLRAATHCVQCPPTDVAMCRDDVRHNPLLMDAQRNRGFRQEAARPQRTGGLRGVKMTTAVGPATVITGEP